MLCLRSEQVKPCVWFVELLYTLGIGIISIANSDWKNVRAQNTVKLYCLRTFHKHRQGAPSGASVLCMLKNFWKRERVLFFCLFV